YEEDREDEEEEEILDEDVEEEDDFGEPDEEEVDPDSATRAYFFAKEFIKDGTLPEDFKFDENITGQELKKAILEEATGDLDIEVFAKSQGYSEEVFHIAKSLVEGVSPDLIYESQRYKYISNIDLDEQEDVAERVLLEYYLDKGLDEDTANDIITSKVEDGTEISEAKKAQEYFANKSKQLEEEEQRKIESRKNSLQEAKEGVINKIKSRS